MKKIICGSCKIQVSDDHKFCHDCGKEFVSITDKSGLSIDSIKIGDILIYHTKIGSKKVTVKVKVVTGDISKGFNAVIAEPKPKVRFQIVRITKKNMNLFSKKK